MSEEKNSDAIQVFEAQMVEEAKYDTLRKETSRNKAVLDNARTKAQLERHEQDVKDLEILSKSDFGIQTKEQIEAIQRDNAEYMEAARNKMAFIINDQKDEVSFGHVVPFFRKNLILVGAQTGDGKSTAVANIAYHLMTQKNKVTGRNARILILTNEERKEDVYNRITCLIKGWAYTNHDKFDDAQKKAFNDAIPVLSTRITVIDTVHNGAHGTTTTIEGIEGIFENLLANKEFYDAIIIDYYQNVISSKKDSTLNEYEVQARLTRILDGYKNVYPGPIVLMAQINPPDESDNPPFQYRIQGRKLIMTVSTCAIEMIVDKKKKLTRWKVRKSRFNEAIGEEVETGYDKGRFVPYTNEFRTRIQTEIDKREAARTYANIDHENGTKLKALQEEAKKKEKNGSPSGPIDPKG